MKTPAAIALVAVALYLPSLAARASDSDLIRRCIDTFVAEHFADRAVAVVVKDDSSPTQPLAATGGTRTVLLVANEKSSGKVLGTATCSIKEGKDKKGSVSIGPLTAN